jgi:hypothetical protein
MPNQEHLEILKKGVSAWNQWRADNPMIQPDMQEGNFADANLNGANLNRAYLMRADLTGANLHGANLSFADLSGANLDWACLSEATLHWADLTLVHLREANLNKSDLTVTNLTGARLKAANVSAADLRWANLNGANLSGADVSNAVVMLTTFGNLDLSEVKGLETIKHWGPSTIGIDTIYKSKGKIPDSFLRSAGVADNFIQYMRSLVGEGFEYYSCFISYSSRDQEFADRLHADLQNKGVRCWLATEDLKIGDKFRQRIDDAIRFHDKLLVILSESSVRSTWVESEVEAAFERESRQDGQQVLFPIRLDDAVMGANQSWAADIRRKRHIGDFSDWRDHDSYQNAFLRLLRDLQSPETPTATC